ncbi:MAG: iron-containing alcohol dehydrogenase family protein [Faecousia sp.]
MEQFSCTTRVVSGEGALDALGEKTCRKMLLVMEPGAQQDRIIRAAGNPVTEVFDAQAAAPTMKRAVEGSKQLMEFQPDLVVALGTEPVLDLGKAMTCFSKHACTLAVIPTAFGAGAELTDWVTLYHNGRCHLLRDLRMRPDLVILDDKQPASAGREKIGENGFELLVAALESYSGRRKGFLSDLYAREAFASGWAALPAAFAGNTQAMKKLQTISVLVGLATQQTGLGLCRAMENSLGAVFGLSRGKAAGILLPAVMGCNAHAAGRRYAELSRAAGMGGSREDIGTRNLKTGLIRLRRELGLPGTLVQAGIDLRAVWNSGRRIVEMTLEDPACRNNPVMADDFLIRRILEEITGRI